MTSSSLVGDILGRGLSGTDRSDGEGLRRKRSVGIVVRLAAFSMLGGLAALAYLWQRRNEAVTLPAPGGRYAVGRVGYDWVDTSRLETLSNATNSKRELMVWVWYPAVPQLDTPPAPYLPGAWGKAEERERGVWALFNQRLDSIRTHAIASAPVSPVERMYPVVLLQPGLGRLATDYTVLAEALASHGYVVVGSTPTYSAGVVVFADGRVARATALGSLPESLSADEPAGRRILDRLVRIWAADNVFVLNQLERLHTADSTNLFTGRLDLHAVGVFGHSLGGASAVQTCCSDPRFKAAVNIDGGLYADATQSETPCPCMFIWSDLPSDAGRPPRQATCDRPAGVPSVGHKAHEIVIKGARHLNFADLAVLYSPGAKVLGALGPIDGRRGLAITADYVRAFFDSCLKNADTPLLKGLSPDYPEVWFESC